MNRKDRKPCAKGDATFGKEQGITNGAAWYSVRGGKKVSHC